MSKIIYDVIQRFEVENGIPRLVSTNIQVIQGGEDLLSLAISLLTQMGFYEKFEEKRTSQYVGYRLKNPGKGDKRYQLVLSERKESLNISITKDILEQESLKIEECLVCGLADSDESFYNLEYEFSTLGIIWIIPSKEDVFLQSIQDQYPSVFEGDTTGVFKLYYDNYFSGEISSLKPKDFSIEKFAASQTYLILTEDKLFPYVWQVSISSKEVLREFITSFARILMEQQ
ncbi:hypothetical protein IQ264_04150 [Phormidium sp. LEGE 05292]|uniref:hypothetical protein n=1 Tax=[Phormidium] sp. LEGE 05292 TaxID=767427 RepID=UPI00187FDD35|nr:hypothetical protein [Phormidium sp. LEGE 05292]MBE9224662.1 hypothetical protein [Phormidium sp. LEGE 05292]